MGNGVHHFNHLVPTIIRVRFAPSARLIHIVEVVKTVGLSHKAVLVQQKAAVWPQSAQDSGEARAPM